MHGNATKAALLICLTVSQLDESLKWMLIYGEQVEEKRKDAED